MSPGAPGLIRISSLSAYFNFHEAAMSATAALLWYIVVSGPQGGLTTLPSPFDQRDQCLAAVKEYEATRPPANWALQCVPAAPAIGEDEAPDEGAPQQPVQ
jgi:hypothetical protein